MKKDYDGFIGIANYKGLIICSTSMLKSAVGFHDIFYLKKLAREAGYNDNSFQIMSEGDDSQMYITVIIDATDHTPEWRNAQINELKHMIQTAHIMQKPMMCTLKKDMVQCCMH